MNTTDLGALAPLQTGPLSTPLTVREVRQYRRLVVAERRDLRLRIAGVVRAVVGIVVGSATVLIVVVVALFFTLLGVAAILGQLEGVRGALLAAVLALILIDLVGTVFIVRAVVDVLRRDGRPLAPWRRRANLARFAHANDLLYTPEVQNPAPLGLPFAAGTRRRAVDIIGSLEDLGFEIGNYQYASPTVLQRRLRQIGFVRLGLPRPVPQIVLLSRSRRLGRTTIPWRLPADQEVMIGGTLEKHFRVFCPDGREEAVRYLLTPRIAALLSDAASSFDLEMSGYHLWVYSPRPFRMGDPTTYHTLDALRFGIQELASARASTFMEEADSQRIGVAPLRRRLRIHAPLSVRLVGALALVLCAVRVSALILGLHF